jgi:hypothetical protein
MGVAHDKRGEYKDEKLGFNMKYLVNAWQLQHRLTSIPQRYFVAVVRSPAACAAQFLRQDRKRWQRA